MKRGYKDKTNKRRSNSYKNKKKKNLLKGAVIQLKKQDKQPNRLSSTTSTVIAKVLEYKLGNGSSVYYKVNEISKLTGLSRQQIHNYTQLGLIEEVCRTEAGHRFYSKETIDKIFLIEMLKRHRTLSEVREIIQSKFNVNN